MKSAEWREAIKRWRHYVIPETWERLLTDFAAEETRADRAEAECTRLRKAIQMALDDFDGPFARYSRTTEGGE